MRTERITVWQRAVMTGVLSGCLLTATTPAEAQRWGRPRVPQAGACFYKNANFGGDYFCVGAGEQLDSMPSGLNDRISSIRTFGNVEVTVFRNPGFGGRSDRFDESVSNLQLEGWNDTLSSLQVRQRGFGGFGGYGRGDGRGSDRDNDRWNGGGNGRNRQGDPDRIVTRAYQDLLGRDPDRDGFREYRRHILDDGWTEAEVREAIRRSPEFREQNGGNRGRVEERDRAGVSRERAEDVVRRAYQSVLGRDPDAGAQGFVTRVMRDNWSQQDVERELRKSPEFRNRRPPQ